MPSATMRGSVAVGKWPLVGQTTVSVCVGNAAANGFSPASMKRLLWPPRKISTGLFTPAIFGSSPWSLAGEATNSRRRRSRAVE